MMVNLRQQGVDNRQLRHGVKTKFETIYCQSRINELQKEGKVEFEIQHAYKSPMVIHQTNCDILSLKL